MAVLGISTNTRLVSVAILAQNELLEYFTHLHKSPWSPVKRDEIIASLEPCVRQYSITRVVLSIPYAYHETKAYQTVTKSIIAFFQEKGIPVATKTPDAFHAFCPEGTKKGKKGLMLEIALMFPELRHCYQKELRNKNKYYYKLFEAVGAAVLGQKE